MGQRLLAAGQRLLVVAQEGVKPTDRVERLGLAARVAGDAVQLQYGLSVAQRLVVPAFGLQDERDGVVGMRCATRIVDLYEQVERTPEIGVAVPGQPEPGLGVAEVAVRMSLSLPVSGRARGPQGGAVDVDQAVPVRHPVQEVGENPGQLPGMGGEAGGCGVRDRGQQDLPVGGEPGHRPRNLGQLVDDHTGLPGRQGDRVPGTVQAHRGGETGVQVVVEHPVDRRPPLGR